MVNNQISKEGTVNISGIGVPGESTLYEHMELILFMVELSQLRWELSWLDQN